MRIKTLLVGGALVAALFAAAACTDAAPANNDQQAAQTVAEQRANYVPVNDVEGKNYNARLRLADQASTLLWCTIYPTSPNAKAFTVPIAGKLTSGNKRTFPTSITKHYTDNGSYYPELPGNDGMYGSSGEYRYGFGPDGTYHDFYNLETYCTTVPNIIQKEQTTIVVKTDRDLTLVDAEVEKALAACRKANPDPSAPCPAAAAILGGN